MNSISEARPALSPDDKLIFADEVPGESEIEDKREPWKILIADDEEEVHTITRMVMEDFVFDNSSVELLHAYTGWETKKILSEIPDIAIILLDVVMETDDAGLEVVRYIREELANKFIRIILRTGQPGKAPEREVISGFDINDYKEKTELTAQKLFTTITSSLRAYKDLRIIEKNRKGLEIIINSTGQLFANQRLKTFTEGVLIQLSSILQMTEDTLFLQAFGFVASDIKDNFKIIAATGKYNKFVNSNISDTLSNKIQHYLNQAIQKEKSLFVDDVFVGFFKTKSNFRNLMFLEGCGNLTDMDKDLIRVFSVNVGVAFDNIYLNREINNTQKEVIETIGGIIETRCRETGNHVKRVAEYAQLLAIKAGMGRKDAEILKYASPMHDVGKIGIPDAILNKPGKLTKEEFESIKKHTSIGYQILKNSKRQIIKAAAIVANQHHERWDGKGYPNGLEGENIHIFGRIICLIDVFDAVSNERFYKPAWSIEKTLDFIRKEKGKTFDPALVDIFMDNVDEFLEISEKYCDDLQFKERCFLKDQNDRKS